MTTMTEDYWGAQGGLKVRLPAEGEGHMGRMGPRFLEPRVPQTRVDPGTER